jgi:hypothetical protein
LLFVAAAASAARLAGAVVPNKKLAAENAVRIVRLESRGCDGGGGATRDVPQTVQTFG